MIIKKRIFNNKNIAKNIFMQPFVMMYVRGVVKLIYNGIYLYEII